jgi:CheY-like chemotaxis protein/HPt (histidine-containing phosphotransfer) domain-containing protein
MKGEIGCISEPGKGSTFWFWLPLSEVNDTQAVFEVEAVHVPNRAGRILVAEDVAINQEIIATILTAAGHEVDVVSNGAEAIQAVQRKLYDLVLMDVQMPLVDGIQATERIRALDTEARSIPIIALTANVYAEQVASFLRAGMNDHIGKPIDRPKLLAAVERALQVAPLFPAVAGDETAASVPVFDRAIYDDLAELMGESGMARLLARLHDQLSGLGEHSGQAVELNREEMAGHAHKLVSAAGMIGFGVFSQLCAEFEKACLSDGDVEELLRRVYEARDEVLQEISRLQHAAPQRRNIS